MTLKTRVAVALLILFTLHYNVLLKLTKTTHTPAAHDNEELSKLVNNDHENSAFGDQENASKDENEDSQIPQIAINFPFETDIAPNLTNEETQTKYDDALLYNIEKTIFKRDADGYETDLNNISTSYNESIFNDTITEEEYLEHIRQHIYPKKWTWVLICLHSIVFVIGLVGNTLVCVAVYRNHTMRTVTNYFIVNLAVADFLVILFCLPPSVVWDVTSTWFFGTAMCKIVLYLQVGVCL